MFGFRKKEPQKIDYIYRNLDDQPVIDRSTGEFLMDFDFEQKNILRFLLDNGAEIRSFAYKGLPAEYMELIKNTIMPPGYTSPREFDERIMYRIVHTDLSILQMEPCLDAMMHNIDMCSEIEDISRYHDHLLWGACMAAKRGVNLFGEFKPDMVAVEFGKKVNKAIEKNRKKEDRRRMMDSIKYFLFDE